MINPPEVGPKRLADHFPYSTGTNAGDTVELGAPFIDLDSAIPEVALGDDCPFAPDPDDTTARTFGSCPVDSFFEQDPFGTSADFVTDISSNQLVEIEKNDSGECRIRPCNT